MRRELHSAFRRTHYRVFIDGELLLRVDQAEPRLAALLRANHAHGAALLTAFNPQARRHAPFLNRRMQQRLRDELSKLGYALLAGCNEDPRGLWPAEPSLLVPGLALDLARKLAARYGQIAFLWIEEGGTPRLIEAAARAG